MKSRFRKIESTCMRNMLMNRNAIQAVAYVCSLGAGCADMTSERFSASMQQ